jgi:hypothetical protein
MRITSEFPVVSGKTPFHVKVGAIFWILWIVQNIWPPQIPVFDTLRVTFTYRLLTGFALVAFIGFQWMLPYLRHDGKIGAAAKNLVWHRRLGAIAPVLYFLHAPRFGYGFLGLLSASFLTNAALATFGYDRSLRSKTLWLTWLFVHIVAACMVLALGAIHIVTALYYE